MYYNETNYEHFKHGERILDTASVYLIVCPLVFLAGLIDSVAGGGGLISLPAYLAAGIPPHMALATNKCSSTFGTLLSTLRFMKNKRVHYLSAAISAAFALLGSHLGAALSLYVDEKYLSYILLAALPMIAVTVFIKKDFGTHNKVDEVSQTKLVLLSAATGFIVGGYDGFFGPGTGMFLILIYTGLIGFDLVTASGNAKIVNLASNVSAFLTFALSGNILWQVGLPAALFGIAGNWLGSGLALKNGKKIIRPMFLAALILLFVKIAYDLIF